MLITTGLNTSTPFLCICRVNELQDPTYQYKVDIVNFQVRLFFKWLRLWYRFLDRTVIFDTARGKFTKNGLRLLIAPASVPTICSI